MSRIYAVNGLEMPETIRDWLREMCIIAPKVMHRVTTMKFGNLNHWLTDSKGQNIDSSTYYSDDFKPPQPIEGCLVGSTALAFNEMMSCAVTPHWHKQTIEYILAEFLSKCIPELGLTQRNLNRINRAENRSIPPASLTLIEQGLLSFCQLTEEAGRNASTFAVDIVERVRYTACPLTYVDGQRLAVKQFKKFIRDTLKELGN